MLWNKYRLYKYIILLGLIFGSIGCVPVSECNDTTEAGEKLGLIDSGDCFKSEREKERLLWIALWVDRRNTVIRSMNAKESEFKNLIDNYRDQYSNCGAFLYDDSLHDLAEEHSVDMSRNDYFGHVNPDGEGLPERLGSINYSYFLVKENISFGMSDVHEVFNYWLDREEMRDLLEDCRYSRYGVGFSDDVRYWTVLFVSK